MRFWLGTLRFDKVWEKRLLFALEDKSTDERKLEFF
jgi:hypothetical protein